MNINRCAIAAAFFLTGGVSSAFAANDWSVNEDLSSLTYVSTKKEHVAKNHVISGISGGVDASGNLSISLDMDTVDSEIEVRDQRMKDWLYKVDSFPAATFSAEIDLDEYSSLEVGESTESFVEGELSLVGITTEIEFDVLVTRTGEDSVIVNTAAPVIVSANNLQINEVVEALKSSVQLSSISDSVPVYMTIVLVK
ncbi:MAG: YceI family protein [Rhizobiaceae bacterium]|nr:YceI family protein [Rhizobiaceae bacterium]